MGLPSPCVEARRGISITNTFVMRGLDPRIHVLAAKEDVDGRIKSGHDGNNVVGDLPLDLRKIRHGMKRGADLRQKLQAVLAIRLVVDLHLLEEGIYRCSQ